jgi:hypothetical protein
MSKLPVLMNKRLIPGQLTLDRWNAFVLFVATANASWVPLRASIFGGPEGDSNVYQAQF